MQSFIPQIQYALVSVLGVIEAFGSLYIGSLHKLSQVILETDCAATLPYIIAEGFLQPVIVLSKSKQNCPVAAYALLAIDLIIFNGYLRAKEADELRLNHSFYIPYPRESSFSGKSSILGDRTGDQLPRFLAFVQSFVRADIVFKKLKIISENHANRNMNHRHLESLIETIRCICKKELPIDFERILNNHCKNLRELNCTKSTFDTKAVNYVLFGNQFYKVVGLLTASDHPLQSYVPFCLSRIYYAALTTASNTQTRAHFESLPFAAIYVFYSLVEFYVSSFKHKVELFEQNAHPLYWLLRVYLITFFMPAWGKLHRILDKCLGLQFNSAAYFYAILHDTNLMGELMQWVSRCIRGNLGLFLNRVYLIIYSVFKYEDKTTQPMSSTVPVKRFLLYSFLFAPELISCRHRDPRTLYQFQPICSLVVNLFFVSSLRKAELRALPGIAVQSITELSSVLDDKISHYTLYDMGDLSTSQLSQIYDEEAAQGTDSTYFFLGEPMLNHDYETLTRVLASIYFTPKDLKAFKIKPVPFLTIKPSVLEMDQLQDLLSEVNAADKWKKPIAADDKNSEDLDFAVWMTVGGSHDYTKPATVSKRNRPKIQVTSFSKESMQYVKESIRKCEINTFQT